MFTINGVIQADEEYICSNLNLGEYYRSYLQNNELG